MDDFKKLTEQLLKIYINAESVNDLEIEKAENFQQPASETNNT